jgi:hypothetical protein
MKQEYGLCHRSHHPFGAELLALFESFLGANSKQEILYGKTNGVRNESSAHLDVTIMVANNLEVHRQPHCKSQISPVNSPQQPMLPHHHLACWFN